jgi:hypothetical protein
MSILSGFSKSFKVDGEFLEVGGNWTCHRHVPEHHRRESERVVSPLLIGGGVLPLKILKF